MCAAGCSEPERNTPASEIRYENAAKQLAFARLQQCPESQAEAICKHYVAHAVLALDTLRLIEAARFSEDRTSADYAIKSFVATIKRNHLHDFGIELEWRSL